MWDCGTLESGEACRLIRTDGEGRDGHEHAPTEDVVDDDEEVVRCVGGDCISRDIDDGGDGFLSVLRCRAVVAIAHVHRQSWGQSRWGHDEMAPGSPRMPWKTRTCIDVERASLRGLDSP